MKKAIPMLKYIFKVIMMLWYFLFKNEVPVEPLITANV